MALTKKKMLIEVNENINTLATAVQLDANSRYLDVFLYDGGVPIDLSGHVVRIHVKKTDGTTIFNQGEITDATAGRCQFALTTDMLNEAQTLEAQISIWSDDTEILSTKVFKILVTESLRNDEEVEATNEFGVMVVLFTEVLSALNLMKEMTETFGLPSDKAADMGATTFWQMLEELALRADARSIIKENINSTMDTERFIPIDKMLSSASGTEDFVPIDIMLQAVLGGKKTFTKSGTFTVPDSVTNIRVTAAAGGGGGCYNYYGGGGGACIVNQYFDVTPGEVIEITVGKGGAGGSRGDSGVIDPIAGSPTVVGNLITLPGGGVSDGNSSAYDVGGVGGSPGGGNGGASFCAGEDGAVGKGGESPASAEYTSGGGGGGSYGNGGDGGHDADPYDASACPGKNGIYGGGGGAGWYRDYRNYSNGGNGGDGIVIISWGVNQT